MIRLFNGKKLLDIIDFSGNKLTALPTGSVAVSMTRYGQIYGNAFKRRYDDIKNSSEEQELVAAAVDAAAQKFIEDNFLVDENFDRARFDEAKQQWRINFENEKENARQYAESNGLSFDEQEWEDAYRADNPEPRKTDRYSNDGGTASEYDYKYYSPSAGYFDEKDKYIDYVRLTSGTFSEYEKIKYDARQAAAEEFSAANPAPVRPGDDATQAELDRYEQDCRQWNEALYQAMSEAEEQADILTKLYNLSDYTVTEAQDLIEEAKTLFGDITVNIGIRNRYSEDWTTVTVAAVFYNDNATDYAYLSDDLYDLFADRNGGSYYSSTYLTKYVEPEDAFISTVYVPYEHTQSAVEELVGLTYMRGDDDSTTIIGNSQMAQLDMFIELADTLGTAFLIAGIVLALFAFLLMFNFISASITAKKKEIGILRAIGARTLDVYKIFMSEALIIALICFAVSTAGTFGLCMLLNGIITEDTFIVISVFSFGPLSVLCIAGVAILTAVVATVIPVALYSRKPPIASIRAL